MVNNQVALFSVKGAMSEKKKKKSPQRSCLNTHLAKLKVCSPVLETRGARNSHRGLSCSLACHLGVSECLGRHLPVQLWRRGGEESGLHLPK